MAAKWESRNYLAALVAGTALLAAAGSGAASGAANASEDTPVAAATKAPPFLNRTFAIVRCPNLPQFFPKGARQTTALSPHRKSTPTKRKKRKWAAKTKGENNISDAAAAKSAIEQKSTALFSSSSSLCFTRAVVAGLRRVAHTVGVTVARLLQSCPSAERQPRKIFYTEDRSLPFPTPQSLTLFSSDYPLLIRRLPVLL